MNMEKEFVPFPGWLPVFLNEVDLCSTFPSEIAFWVMVGALQGIASRIICKMLPKTLISTFYTSLSFFRGILSRGKKRLSSAVNKSVQGDTCEGVTQLFSQQQGNCVCFFV